MMMKTSLTGLLAVILVGLLGSTQVLAQGIVGKQNTGKPTVARVIPTPLKADLANVITPRGIIRPEAMPLRLDAEIFRMMESRKAAGSVFVESFPLAPGHVVDLELKPYEVLTPDARIVLMERGPDGVVRERELDRPTASLWAGRVAGQPDSMVFLGLSEKSCQGYIRSDDGMHIIASPPKGDGPVAVYRVGDEPGSLRLPMDQFSCHVEELRGLPHGPQVAEIDDLRPPVLPDLAGGWETSRTPPPGGGTGDQRNSNGTPDNQYTGACCIANIGSGDELGQCITTTLWECENIANETNGEVGIYLGHNTNCSTLGGDAACSNEPFDCFRVRVAIDTDVEFLNLPAFGGDVEAAVNYIYMLTGASSQIYDHNLTLRLHVPWIRLWSAETDGIVEKPNYEIWEGDGEPWTSTNTSGQLSQFRNYWQSAAAPPVERDLMHLLSGRPLGGGIAYLSAVCSGNGYSVSANLLGEFPYPITDFNGTNWDLIVFTHELGHNFGTGHTHSYPYDLSGDLIDSCAYNCVGPVNYNATIMSYCHLCPNINGNSYTASIQLRFHPYTRGKMYNFLRNLSCAWQQVDGDLLAVDDLDWSYPGLPINVDVLRNDRGYLCDNDNVTIDPTDLSPTSILGGTVEIVEVTPPDGSDPREFIEYVPPCGLATASAPQFDLFDYTIESTSPGAPAGLNDNATVRVRLVYPQDTDPGVYTAPLFGIDSIGVQADPANQNVTFSVPPGIQVIAIGWVEAVYQPAGLNPPDTRFRLNVDNENELNDPVDIDPFADVTWVENVPVCGAVRLDFDTNDYRFTPADGVVVIEFYEQQDDFPGQSDGTWQGGEIYIWLDQPSRSDGACCIETLCTFADSVEDCEAQGGGFQGPGTICTAQSCIVQPTVGGACCVTLPEEEEPSCTIATQFACQDQDGVYQGDGTECLAQTCNANATAEGACCLTLTEDVVCSISTEKVCVDSGGDYLGDDTFCDDFTCQESDPIGACCLTNGNCIEVLQSLCENSGSIFLGAGVACDDEVDCEILTGVCCVGEACLDLLEEECDEVDGDFGGVGTVCSITSCLPEPEGACCLFEVFCVDATETACQNNGGNWLGEGTVCIPGSCDGADAFGACCFEQLCLYRQAEDCDAIGGTFLGVGTTCTGNTCLMGVCCLGEICLQGTREACDVVSGEFLGYGLPCEDAACTGCPPDINGDGTVDVNDLLVILEQFGNAGGNADVNGDGIVDVNDVLILIANWGGDGC